MSLQCNSTRKPSKLHWFQWRARKSCRCRPCDLCTLCLLRGTSRPPRNGYLAYKRWDQNSFYVLPVRLIFIPIPLNHLAVGHTLRRYTNAHPHIRPLRHLSLRPPRWSCTCSPRPLLRQPPARLQARDLGRISKFGRSHE
jgi:hypothetical protein